MTLSVIGIVISLAVIVVLALRGMGIMLIAPLAVVIVSLFSGMGVLETLMGPYMKGFINYAAKFYLVFLFASVFGKYMDDSGAAKSIARGILSVIGHEKPLYVLLAEAGITLCLPLGGVSRSVLIFAVMRIARPLFRQLNIPWHLVIAAFIFGIGSISMTMMPGTPSIINIMPMKYLGTSAAAAPLLGIAAAIFVGAFNVWYMNSQLKKSIARGEGYDVNEIAATAVPATATVEKELPNFWVSLIPSIAIIVALNVFKIDIVWSLVIGCATAAIFFFGKVENHLATLNAGAANTAIPVINTCADVGYGMAVAASVGFKAITEVLMAFPGHEENIIPAGQFNAFANGVTPVFYYLKGIIVPLKTLHNFANDRFRIFASRIVRRNNRHIRHPGCYTPHNRPLCPIPVAAASEYQDKPPFFQAIQHLKHLFQGIRGMGVVHKNRRAVLVHYPFQSSRYTAESFHASFDRCKRHPYGMPIESGGKDVGGIKEAHKG